MLFSLGLGLHRYLEGEQDVHGPDNYREVTLKMRIFTKAEENPVRKFKMC